MCNFLRKKAGDHYTLVWFGPESDKGGRFSFRVIDERLGKENIKLIYGSVENPAQTIIDGKVAYYFGEGDAGCGGPDYRVGLNNTTQLSIRFNDCELQEPYIKDYTDQILSTFKFIK